VLLHEQLQPVSYLALLLWVFCLGGEIWNGSHIWSRGSNIGVQLELLVLRYANVIYLFHQVGESFCATMLVDNVMCRNGPRKNPWSLTAEINA